MVFTQVFKDVKEIDRAREVVLKGNARESCNFFTNQIMSWRDNKTKIVENLKIQTEILNDLLFLKNDETTLLRSVVIKSLDCNSFFFSDECRLKKSMRYEIETKTTNYVGEVNIYPLIMEFNEKTEKRYKFIRVLKYFPLLSYAFDFTFLGCFQVN